MLNIFKKFFGTTTVNSIMQDIKRNIEELKRLEDIKVKEVGLCNQKVLMLQNKAFECSKEIEHARRVALKLTDLVK